MLGLIAMTLLGSPWVDSPHFPRAQQERAYAATLRLRTANGDLGTAVRVAWSKEKQKAIFLTAAHVVKNDKEVDLEWFDPKTGNVAGTIYGARIIQTWPTEDLAVLAAREANPPIVMPVGPLAAKAPELPMPVISVGCQLGAPDLWLDAIQAQSEVTKVDPDKAEAGKKCLYWRVQKPSILGRSGGPLMDRDGNLVGICSGNAKEMTFYVHLEELHKCLKKIPFEGILPAEPGRIGSNQKN